MWRAVLLASCVVGCASPDICQRAPRPDPAGVYSFVFARYVVDVSAWAASGPVAGFNLDGRYSAQDDADGCSREDSVSALDLDQNRGGCDGLQRNCQGGVDNQYPALANEMTLATGVPFDVRLAREVAIGHRVLLLRVTGVEDLTNDDHVVAMAYPGFLLDPDCGRLGAGTGHFAVDRVSLVHPSDIDSAKARFEGRIVNGRLEVRLAPGASFELPFPDVLGRRMVLPLHDAQLRVTIGPGVCDDPAPGPLRDGNLGGWVLGYDLLRQDCNAFPDDCDTIEGLVGALADLRLNTAASPPRLCVPGDDPADCQCGGVSGTRDTSRGAVCMGLGFELVPAAIDPMPRSDAPAGACHGSCSDEACGAAGSCRGVGQACGFFVGICCGATHCGMDQRCACVAAGGVCGYDGECCGGRCDSGRCGL